MAYWRWSKRTPRSFHIIWLVMLLVTMHLYLGIDNHGEPLRIFEGNANLPGYSSSAVELLKNKYLHPPSKENYNIRIENPQYIAGEIRHGSLPVRVLVKSIFKNQKNGFFIEAGALDGVYLSNTLKLEQENNWTGLLIEPNPDSYKLLLQKNRKTWSSNTCISSDNFTKETVLVALTNDMEDFPMSVRGSSYELGHQQNSSYVNHSDKNYVTVKCFPLVTYLLALNVKTVDFLSLDIQGPEQQVLDTLPYGTINFRLIVIENYVDELDTKLIADMKLRGFRYLFDDCENYMFLKEGDKHLDSIVLGQRISCNYTIGATIYHD